MTSTEMKAIRIRLGMTQGELALALGTTAVSGGRRIRRFEKGGEPIPQAVADRIRNLCPEEAQ